MEDPFNIEALKIDPTDPKLVPARTAGPTRPKNTPHYFVKVPIIWLQKLDAAPGQTCRLALHLLFLHFQSRGSPITLANRTLEDRGIPGQSKRRALRDLERRGLVSVEWRMKRSPIVRVLAD